MRMTILLIICIFVPFSLLTPVFADGSTPNSEISHYDDFNDDPLDTSYWFVLEGNPGITVKTENSEIRVSGVTQNTNWEKNGLRASGFPAQSFEVSIDYRLMELTDQVQSVNLRVYYDQVEYFGVGYDDKVDNYIAFYNDGNGFHQLPHTIKAIGYETIILLTFKIVYDDSRSLFRAYVDDVLIDTHQDRIRFGTFDIQFQQESQVIGEFDVDARFDNFRITSIPRADWVCVQSGCPSRMSSLAFLSPSDGWAVGESIQHWDGSNWKTMTNSKGNWLADVDMVSSTYGWAVGPSGTLLRWDGIRWTEFPSPTSVDLYSVDMTSYIDGWASGGQGTILHWDGTKWEIARSEGPGYDKPLNDIEMLSPVDGWAVGYTTLHWDGSAWSEVAPPTPPVGRFELYSVSMLSQSEGWAVGVNSLILYWDGSEWQIVPSPTMDALFSVDMVSADDGWIVGSWGQILHWDGNEWIEVSGFDPEGAWYHCVAMASDTDGWIIVNNLMNKDNWSMRWDGHSWQPSPNTNNYQLNSVMLSSNIDGWAVGNEGKMLHWNGNNWQSADSPTTLNLNSVYTLSDSNAWAVGDQGLILQLIDNQWQEIQSPVSNTLHSVMFVTPTAGWAGGEAGVLLQFDGRNWKVMDSPGENSINTIYMISETEGWAAAGDITAPSGALLYWDGVSWETIPEVTDAMYSISMIHPNDGWAVGADWGFYKPVPVFYHWDGVEWRLVNNPSWGLMYDVIMISEDDGWAVGEDGEFLHWNGAYWSRVPGPTNAHLYSVSFSSAHDGWAVGHGPGVILRFNYAIHNTYFPILLGQ